MAAGKNRWIIILLLSVFIAASVFIPTYASIEGEIEERQQELEDIEKRRRDEESALEQRLNREAALKEELEALESRINELRAELDQLAGEIKEVEREISRTEAELAEAEEELSRQEELLNLRLRAIQQYGMVPYIEVLFEAKSFSDFLTRLHNLSIIASNDMRLIEEIQAERDLIQAKKDELDEKKRHLENMRSQVAANEAEMEQAAAEREIILEGLQVEIARNMEAIGNLEQEAEELESLIRQLIVEAQSQFSGVEGDLFWPIEPPTRITSGYGWRRDPFTGARAWHGGVDIAPYHGAANYILAAADGQVVFSGWNGGYGNCIMIDHGSGTLTLYAHMSSLLVQKGDVVTAGQRIARAGTTGYSTGVHLHFEVREYERDPVRRYPSGAADHRYNPMDYF